MTRISPGPETQQTGNGKAYSYIDGANESKSANVSPRNSFVNIVKDLAVLTGGYLTGNRTGNGLR